MTRFSVVAIVALVLLVASTLVAAMSPRDAFEEAKKFHKHDANFQDNYNVYQDHNGMGTHPGLMGGRFGSIHPPVYDTMNMPHAPGGDYPLLD